MRADQEHGVKRAGEIMNWTPSVAQRKTRFALGSRRLALLLVAGMVACSADTVEDSPAGGLETLLTWFEGEFDNREQVVQEDAGPRHLFVTRLDMPLIPGEALYLQWHSGDATGPIDSQRIWAFTETPAGIQMRFYTFEATAQAVLTGITHRADADVSRVRSLTLDDLYAYPEACTFLLRRSGDVFSGKNGRGECRIFNRSIDRMMVPDVTLRISADAIVEDAVYYYEPADREPAQEAVLQEFLRVPAR